MKIFLQTLLVLSMLITVNVNAQTTKKTTPTKTATPVKKTTVKKPATQQSSAAKAAAVAKAKEDSVAAVNALAMQMARQIIREDSIKKAQAAEQLAAEEKLKQEQLAAEEKKTATETNAKSKPKTEKVAKTKPQKKQKEPVKTVPDELRPTTKPQETVAEAKTFIGLRAMGIGSFVVGKDVTSDFKPLIGYGGGLVANFGMGKHLSFQPEVLYVQEGFVIKTEILEDIYEASVVVNTVQVPLLFKYSFGESNKGFFVNVGPYGNYSINVTTNDKTTGAGKTTQKPEKTIIDFGLAGGLGVAVPLGRGRLLVEARGTYYLGSTEKTDESIDAKIVTGTFSVGYLFAIGH